MPQAPSERPGASTDLLLGEMIAEIRAVKHAQNNSAQKLDAVASLAATQKNMLEDMQRLELEQQAHNLRIAVLEVDKNRREGAIGLVAWISRNWPVAFVIAVIGGIVAWANGRLHP